MYCIVENIGGIQHGGFSYFDFLEEKNLVNGLTMSNGYQRFCISTREKTFGNLPTIYQCFWLLMFTAMW